MVHLPASGVLFAGDVLDALPGAALQRRRFPGGLLAALAFIASLRPRLLIHGHTTLTEVFTAGAVPGLAAALTQLHGEVLDGIRAGRTLPDILEQASLPVVLRDHPTAVVPYLVIRDHFTERLYHQRTGYWQPDGTGDSSRRPRPSTPPPSTCWPEAGKSSSPPPRPPSSARAITPSPWQIIQPGLLRHPASTTLAGLRRTALHRLMEAYQQSDPFKFLIYAELRRRDRPGPVAARRTPAPVIRACGPGQQRGFGSQKVSTWPTRGALRPARTSSHTWRSASGP